MSFSSTTMALCFLLGEDDGTVPLGRALKNKLSLEERSMFFHCFSGPRRSFLPCKHEQSEAKRTKNRSGEVLHRAIVKRVRQKRWREEWVLMTLLWGTDCSVNLHLYITIEKWVEGIEECLEIKLCEGLLSQEKDLWGMKKNVIYIGRGMWWAVLTLTCRWNLLIRKIMIQCIKM